MVLQNYGMAKLLHDLQFFTECGLFKAVLSAALLCILQSKVTTGGLFSCRSFG